MLKLTYFISIYLGPGSSVGIVTNYGLEGPGIESQWGRDFPPVQTGPGAQPRFCKNGYRVFPGGKVWPGRAADHSLPSSAAVMEGKSYTSTHPLGHTRPVTGSLYLYLYNTEVHAALVLSVFVLMLLADLHHFLICALSCLVQHPLADCVLLC
jgi:hypothetical protein